MKSLRKFLRFTLENLNGKLIFDRFSSYFLGFRMLLANFSPFTFSLLQLGGPEFFRQVWNSDGLVGESLPCQSLGGTFRNGGTIPKPPQFHTSWKNSAPKPHNANNSPTASRTRENGQKINFLLRFSNGKPFAKPHILIDFSPNAQSFAASFS